MRNWVGTRTMDTLGIMSPVLKAWGLSKQKYLVPKSGPLKIFRASTKRMASKLREEAAKLL
jgi:hypothetical protein